MFFNDNYMLIFREYKYPDCIKFHGMQGVIATVSTHGLAYAVQDYLEGLGYEVREYNENK